MERERPQKLCFFFYHDLRESGKLSLRDLEIRGQVLNAELELSRRYAAIFY